VKAKRKSSEECEEARKRTLIKRYSQMGRYKHEGGVRNKDIGGNMPTVSGKNVASVEWPLSSATRFALLARNCAAVAAFVSARRTNRFKAAVESAGKADLVGHYGEMDRDSTAFGTSVEETGQGLMGGTPWEHRERYIENSPVFYFDRMPRRFSSCMGPKTRQYPLFSGRLGREVEYARYEGEGHIISGDADQRDVCNRMIEWFDRHLKGSGETATSP
jgi:Prolyl oligopeptidase family